MKKIPLTKNYFAIVDDSDFDLVSKATWWTLNGRNGRVYAMSTNRGLMHRMIIGADDYESVDHIDGNSLNNCRGNLRLATVSQNQANAQRRKDNSSGFKGVHQRDNSRWRARLQFNGKRIHVGDFDTPQEAHAAYTRVARECFGEFARP